MRYNADGSLDSSFSGDGKLTTPIGTGDDSANGVAILGTTIVVAGSSLSGSNRSFALVRYGPDGSLDLSFDGDGGQGNGIVTTGITNSCGVNAIAIQFSETVNNPHRIVVAGEASNNVALARYNLNGSLDTSFDGDGFVTTPIPNGGSGRGTAILLQRAGTNQVNVLVAITASFSSGNSVGIARYKNTGALDTTFDSDGILVTAVGSVGSTSNAIALQSDGKILSGGAFFTTRGSGDNSRQDSEFLTVRVNSNGTVDNSFDGDGFRIDDVSDLPATARGVAVQSDGKIVLAGSTQKFVGGERVNHAAVMRCHPDGALDTSFDLDGLATVSGILEPTPLLFNKTDESSSQVLVLLGLDPPRSTCSHCSVSIRTAPSTDRLMATGGSIRPSALSLIRHRLW